MKRMLLVVLVGAILIFSTQFAEAQEKKEGFVKRSFRKLSNLFKKGEKKEEKKKTSPMMPQKEDTSQRGPEIAPILETGPVGTQVELPEATEVITEEEVREEIIEPEIKPDTEATSIEGEEGIKGAKTAVKVMPLLEFPKEDIIERITELIRYTPGVVDRIPTLTATIDKNGNVTEVKYSIDGVYRDLEDIDKKILVKIHIRITNERIHIQNIRIMKQLEAIRASQNIPQTPKIYGPPQIPQTYTPPPSQPKVPTPPPAPPKQHR